MTEQEIEVQIRNERLGITFFFVSLFIAPVVGAIQSDTDLDIIRAFVLTQAIIVFSLYGVALAEGIGKMWRGAYSHSKVTRSLFKARVARITACMIFVAEEFVSVIDRIGNEYMNLRTPLLQIALILLVYAWGFMDRRQFEDPADSEAVARLVDEARDRL